jgi:heat shock protein HtpX
MGLASALEKIDRYNRDYLAGNESAFSNESVQPLCISQPFTKKASRLFATHPPIEERVARLKNM